MNYFAPCDAMITANITDTNSQKGKDFCTEHCPYPNCILFDTEEQKNEEWYKQRSIGANISKLNKRGKTSKEIATILGISEKMVQEYLSKK